LSKKNKIAVDKSTKLVVFLKNLILEQQSNNDKDKDSISFKDKFDKKTIKKKTKIKKIAKNQIIKKATRNKTKNNKYKNCDFKKKEIKKIKKKIVLVKSNISISFEKNISTLILLVLKANYIIAILIDSYISIYKNLLYI